MNMGPINQRPKIDLRKVFLNKGLVIRWDIPTCFKENRKYYNNMLLQFVCISHSLFTKGKGKEPSNYLLVTIIDNNMIGDKSMLHLGCFF